MSHGLKLVLISLATVAIVWGILAGLSPRDEDEIGYEYLEDSYADKSGVKKAIINLGNGSDEAVQNKSVGPSGLRTMVDSQPKDLNWAPETERKLLNGYETIPLLRASSIPVQVSCAATLCEVSGGFSKAGSNFDINKAMADIQMQATSFSDRRMGFKPGATVAFGISGEDPNSVIFTTYFQRYDDK